MEGYLSEEEKEEIKKEVKGIKKWLTENVLPIIWEEQGKINEEYEGFAKGERRHNCVRYKQFRKNFEIFREVCSNYFTFVTEMEVTQTKPETLEKITLKAKEEWVSGFEWISKEGNCLLEKAG